jgi:hypothetical protein
MEKDMSRSKPLASWDAARQQTYRRTHPGETFIFHLLLDGSGSMAAHEEPLRRAYNLYLRWLKQHAPPMSLIDTRCFGSELQPSCVLALGDMPFLDTATYAAVYGGTALRDAVGTVVTEASEPAQHVLIVLTDGIDEDSRRWSVTQIRELLTTMQSTNDWLCIFLGAFPQALEVGSALGFVPGNCLVFGTERIPDAFERLRHATETYLLATPPARKLLAQHGVFHAEGRIV